MGISRWGNCEGELDEASTTVGARRMRTRIRLQGRQRDLMGDCVFAEVKTTRMIGMKLEKAMIGRTI